MDRNVSVLTVDFFELYMIISKSVRPSQKSIALLFLFRTGYEHVDKYNYRLIYEFYLFFEKPKHRN